MTPLAFVRSLGIAVVVSSSMLVGCIADDSGSGSSSGGSGYGGSSGGSGTTSSSGAGTSGQPMLVDVDPNRTMTADPGNGVGVFTQYQTGGHWNIWWTCDTTLTNESCDFDVTVSVTAGSIANAAGQSLASTDSLDTTSSQQLEVLTNTTTGVQGVTFDTVVPDGTTPVITLDAKLEGQDDPSYLFFVQDGAINGNYTGQLTDPLMLEPSVP